MTESKGQVLRLAEALTRIPTESGKPFAELFHHGSLLVEIFAPRGRDAQQPHRQDELYVVVKGSGEFVHGEARDRVGPGDLLFVPAGMVHRFESFSDDLTLWVVFYGPDGGEQP